MLKISARNQLRGKVTKVERGAVNGDVWLDIGDGHTVFANITNAAIDELDIGPEDQLIAIIKSSAILLSTDDKIKISARNRMQGLIERIAKGAVNSEVVMRLPSGQLLTAIVTRATVDELGIEKGSACTALVKASQVILAKEV